MSGVIDFLKDRVEAVAEQAKKKVALEIFDGLIEKTPVDTGRARAGWSMDSRHGGHVPPKDGPFPVGTPNPPEKSSEIVIYNNVEYISILNNGHSKQAPKMFIEGVIQRVADRIND